MSFSKIFVILVGMGFIKNKVKGRKEEDTNHLFEDFKYDEDSKP